MERKLAEIKISKKKIFLYVLMRTPLLALDALACAVAINEAENPNYVAMVVITLLALVFIFSPLRHMGATMTYYENRIVLNKKELVFNNPLEIQWVRRRGYITGTRLVMYKKSDKTGLKEIFLPSDEIDVTYMDMPKEQFISVYLNQVNVMKMM